MKDEPMDPTQAQEHLAMVDRILARAEERTCLNGTPYVVWGLVGGGMDVVTQLVVVQNGTPSLLWVSVALLLTALAFMFFYVLRKARKERRGLLDGHMHNIFMISWIISMVIMILGNHIFAYWAQGAVWSLMFGAAMMYAGSLARSRVSFIGGVIVIASIIAANFMAHYVGYVLAAGFIIGMGGAGVMLMLARGNE